MATVKLDERPLVEIVDEKTIAIMPILEGLTTWQAEQVLERLQYAIKATAFINLQH